MKIIKKFKETDKLENFPPEYYGMVRVGSVLRGVCLRFYMLLLSLNVGRTIVTPF
eukprot:UN01383